MGQKGLKFHFYSLCPGVDFKNNQTTKQLNNFILANRKVQINLFNCLVVRLFLKSAT